MGEYEILDRCPSQILEEIPDDAIILTDEHVTLQWSHALSGRPQIVLPAGEASKSLATFGECLEKMAGLGASRRTHLVAVGGGVIGDLGGFLAATYMRGIPFIQVPTTLLAMVDSSVGGKVGIDLAAGKNLAGAFWPPAKVILVEETLSTLPPRQWTNGMAEVWKYGFIMDLELLELLQSPWEKTAIIQRCIRLKQQVVEADEFETLGIRASLNFGHTIGHAIERITGYGPILHGEAIAIGMVAEATLGERIGFTEPGTADQIRTFLAKEGLPTWSPILREADWLLDAMKTDKKATKGSLAFSLLPQLGHCKLVKDVDIAAIREVLEAA
ncbi:MAG: 3-dehydroquinate synthase [Fimbriimonas sp.]